MISMYLHIEVIYPYLLGQILLGQALLEQDAKRRDPVHSGKTEQNHPQKQSTEALEQRSFIKVSFLALMYGMIPR